MTCQPISPKGKWDVDTIPLDQLIGPEILMGVSGNSLRNPSYRVTQIYILRWKKTTGHSYPKAAVGQDRSGEILEG